MGLVTPWSFVPHPVLMFTDDMSFSQRCYNFLISMADLVIRNLYYIPQQNRLAQEHFAQIEGIAVEGKTIWTRELFLRQ